MLSQLTIKNFGLIDHVSLDFTDQLNILTGETGAGKSILIDALRFVLGDRAQSFHLRDANKTCVVDAVFDLPKELLSSPVLEDFLDEEPTLILQRTLTADNRSRAKINGLNVTVGQLKAVGSALLDFHGPHDHQHLLCKDNHIHMIDQLSNIDTELNQYKTIYRDWLELQQQRAALKDMADTRERDLDMFKHQISELEQVALTDETYEHVEQEHTKVTHAEKLLTHIQELVDIFNNEDVGVDRQLSTAFHPMQHIIRTDEHASKLMDQLDNIQTQTQSLATELTHYADSLQFDPAHAEDISIQYSAYQNILRKYGPTITDAATFYDEIKTKFDALNNMEHSDAELQQAIELKENELNKIAKTLSKKRKATAKKLKQTIETELKELGFTHVDFETQCATSPFNQYGTDDIEFFISPNAGESLKPLAQIVSSGEAARIMLALKKALIHVDPVPVLIFDEIDAQIGGRLGTITGTKLRDIAQERQVILITHLPQIASFAQTHYKITKSVIDGRATTQVSPLADDDRIDELAQMMSGSDETDISRTHAQELLAKANK